MKVLYYIFLSLAVMLTVACGKQGSGNLPTGDTAATPVSVTQPTTISEEPGPQTLPPLANYSGGSAA